MKPRSISRELALFILFQLDKKEKRLDWEKASFQELILGTVRSLSEMAREQIESVGQELSEVTNYLVDYEITHPSNENVPLEEPTRPVAIPNTKQMVAKLESLMNAVNNLQEALYLPELKTLADREDVQNYAKMLVRNVVTHLPEIDRKIDESAKQWRVERFQKMDLMLLRLAVAELQYNPQVETATVIDETLELADRFTDEDSKKFIHGILGAVANSTVGANTDA